VSTGPVWQQPVTRAVEKTVWELSGLDNDLQASPFRVLDFGCGSGRYMQVFGQWLPQRNIYGVEIDPRQVAVAKHKGLNCLQTDPLCGCLPFRGEAFALVFSSNVVEHIPRTLYLAYLVEIHRVLKPGGRFVVSTPNYPTKRLYDLLKAMATPHSSYYLFDDPTHVNKLTFARLERDLEAVFAEVYLMADRILLESRIPLLRRPDIRQRLRVCGDKIVGYCLK